LPRDPPAARIRWGISKGAPLGQRPMKTGGAFRGTLRRQRGPGGRGRWGSAGPPTCVRGYPNGGRGAGGRKKLERLPPEKARGGCVFFVCRPGRRGFPTGGGASVPGKSAVTPRKGHGRSGQASWGRLRAADHRPGQSPNHGLSRAAPFFRGQRIFTKKTHRATGQAPKGDERMEG